jgi:hypothetical protein
MKESSIRAFHADEERNRDACIDDFDALETLARSPGAL